MLNETYSADWRIQNESSHLGFGIRCECSTEIDMGVNGETRNAMVSNSAKDGESTKNNTYGAIIGNNSGY